MDHLSWPRCDIFVKHSACLVSLRVIGCLQCNFARCVHVSRASCSNNIQSKGHGVTNRSQQPTQQQQYHPVSAQHHTQQQCVTKSPALGVSRLPCVSGLGIICSHETLSLEIIYNYSINTREQSQHRHYFGIAAQCKQQYEFCQSASKLMRTVVQRYSGYSNRIVQCVTAPVFTAIRTLLPSASEPIVILVGLLQHPNLSKS